MAPQVKEGTWFVVPLTPGFVAGLLARASGPVGFGYFFGPRLDSLPDLAALSGTVPSDAILACRFTLGGLHHGEWPILGTAPGWHRADWAIPPLCRFAELQQRYVLVHYDEDVISPESESPLSSGTSPEKLASDDVFGEGLMPTTLTRLLGGHS